MIKLFSKLRKLLCRKPLPQKWESLGSRSYRKAVRELRRRLAKEIRRRAWADDRQYVYLRDPEQDLCCSRIRGLWAADKERYPPGFQLIHVFRVLPWIR